tara:strand:- start:27436 stop:29196 length:1761 start_codon:yes stop_codon:yes gene_type:complete
LDIIQLLPEHIANQIAAGEVIQRPASAVKEMLENALDSGATHIQLFIKDAGKSLIQVVDNGCGMSETDAIMSFERHATSKIKKAEDLFNIKTMGFRGEAMASMAAIAHIELNTKLTNQELGTKIVIEGSEVKNKESCACANGTSIKIKNLFFNVPARRNFLKSDKVENKHIVEQFTRVALANPEISWNLDIDGKQIFRLDSSNFRQRIVNIIGTKTNEKLVPVNEETTLVNISGFVGKPEFAKRTRGEQYFFVNGRFIKNYYLNHAITKSFTDLIAENYHPSYFLNLEINPNLIDINIHPTKTEIKFEDEKSIYAILRSSVKKSLGQYNIAPTLDFNTEPSFEIPIRNNIEVVSEPKIRVNTNYNPFNEEIENSESFSQTIYQNHSEENIQSEISLSASEYSNYSQLNNHFIFCHSKEGIILVHQQRAHQRILYEYFKQNNSVKQDSQKLIFPHKISVTKKESSTILDIQEDLQNIGFQIEVLDEEVEITAVPTHCTEENLQFLFEDIVKYNEIEEIDLKEEIRSKLSKTIAKSLSIKKGQKLTVEEMNLLVTNLMNCEIPSVSPYGLSTYFNISTTEINKKFKKC